MTDKNNNDTSTNELDNAIKVTHVTSDDDKTKSSNNTKDNDIKEINGFENKQEPTTHGDWSIDGRCFDF